MYRLIHPADRHELPVRMLFHPIGEGLFLRGCEADSFRGLVAALLDDPGYEQETTEARLTTRLRLADDVKLLAGISGDALSIADRDGATINVASDQTFIRSLDRIGFVSLPLWAEASKQ
jgi:hypothetical protein